jgi:eukaryotic-like serine/threonine-protein kinase
MVLDSLESNHLSKAAPLCCDSWSDRDLSGSDAGPYRLISRFGKRGGADLYLAVKRRDACRQTVDIKVIDTACAPAKALQRFNLERQLVGRFEHAQLARMLDEGTTSTGAPYLAMEHINAVSITEYARLRSLRPSACLELMLQLCSAVEYLHSKGFVHRDLRPENILVTESGQLKIVDFTCMTTVGVATAHDNHGDRVYTSPEVCLGGSCARASDVYSMGILLHELITGVQPDSAAAWPTRALKTTGIPELDTVICKAVRTAPEERFRSAVDFAQRIQRLL